MRVRELKVFATKVAVCDKVKTRLNGSGNRAALEFCGSTGSFLKGRIAYWGRESPGGLVRQELCPPGNLKRWMLERYQDQRKL